MLGQLFGEAINGRSLRMALLNLSTHEREAELRMGGPEILHGPFADDSSTSLFLTRPSASHFRTTSNVDTWPFGAR